MLHLKDVQFSFPQGKALHHINLKIEQGTHVALIGGKAVVEKVLY
ncbi:hypothetical protein JCM19297_2643 [Nonlabens ulvanivorans]|nr:hypothetical protein [Nonlabens ulvanivorans]GAK88130.1 hypothetical protein JCM19297_2643 [Nonlabens ulvanivorans]